MKEYQRRGMQTKMTLVRMRTRTQKPMMNPNDLLKVKEKKLCHTTSACIGDVKSKQTCLRLHIQQIFCTIVCR